MKSNLYTRTGDLGTTSLVGGSRTSKASKRLEAYGTVDELNSWIGLLIASGAMPPTEGALLTTVQHRLFNLGAYLATPVKEGEMPQASALSPKAVSEIEHAIDIIDAATPALRCFVLPGGSILASQIHITRAVCRRAERHTVALQAAEYVDPDAIRYLNRLSDYLFALARYVNHIAGIKDVPWDQKI